MGKTASALKGPSVPFPTYHHVRGGFPHSLLTPLENRIPARPEAGLGDSVRAVSEESSEGTGQGWEGKYDKGALAPPERIRISHP